MLVKTDTTNVVDDHVVLEIFKTWIYVTENNKVKDKNCVHV